MQRSQGGKNGISAEERAQAFSRKTFASLSESEQAQHSWEECTICAVDLRAQKLLGLGDKSNSGVGWCEPFLWECFWAETNVCPHHVVVNMCAVFPQSVVLSALLVVVPPVHLVVVLLVNLRTKASVHALCCFRVLW